MSGRRISWIFIIVLQLVAKLGVEGEPLVPCFFIFGDSLSDSGNNDNLASLAKADFLPYGIDFPGGPRPTGRFTNGRTTVDLIGEYLGMENYIPPFPSAQDDVILNGINYASGSAGIRPETGYQVGQRFSMDQQLSNHQTVISRISNILGNNTSVHLNNCIYSVYAGSNDFMLNYFNPLNFFRTTSPFIPQQFTDDLVLRLSQQLDNLYSYGARKVVLIGLGPLGCLPALSRFGGCLSIVNSVLQGYNDMLKTLADNFNQKYTDAKFIVINTIGIVSADLSGLGLRVSNVPCCGALQFVCLPYSLPCPNRDEFAYWDNAHPTEAANKVLAARAFNAQDPDDAYPMDISHLARL